MAVLLLEEKKVAPEIFERERERQRLELWRGALAVPAC